MKPIILKNLHSHKEGNLRIGLMFVVTVMFLTVVKQLSDQFIIVVMASMTREMGGDLIITKDYVHSYDWDHSPYPGKPLMKRDFTPIDEPKITNYVEELKNKEGSIIEDYSYISYGLNDVFENSFELSNSYNKVMVNIFAVDQNLISVSGDKYLSLKQKWIPEG